MTDKELLEKAARRFRIIADDTNRITSGNLPHNLTCLRGFALRAAESIEKHLQEQEESATSLWHDASEKAEKGKLYLYRTNQNVVDINRSEGKDFPDYCERWAYIDDLLKL